MGAATGSTAGHTGLSLLAWSAVACAACCLGPLLAFFGFGATATAVATLVDPWAGVLSGAVVLAVGGVVLTRRHGRRRTLSNGPQEIGTVCRLPLTDRAQRTADFRRLFEDALLTRTRDGDDVLWTLRATDVSESESRRLAELETRCCAGIRFAVTRKGDEILWRISGPSSARDVLNAFYELPVLVMTDRAGDVWAALDAASCAKGPR